MHRKISLKRVKINMRKRGPCIPVGRQVFPEALASNPMADMPAVTVKNFDSPNANVPTFSKKNRIAMKGVCFIGGIKMRLSMMIFEDIKLSIARKSGVRVTVILMATDVIKLQSSA